MGDVTLSDTDKNDIAGDIRQMGVTANIKIRGAGRNGEESLLRDEVSSKENGTGAGLWSRESIRSGMLGLKKQAQPLVFVNLTGSAWPAAFS